jgi:hypothetical protein
MAARPEPDRVAARRPCGTSVYRPACRTARGVAGAEVGAKEAATTWAGDGWEAERVAASSSGAEVPQRQHAPI